MPAPERLDCGRSHWHCIGRKVSRRGAAQTLAWAERNRLSLLTIALDHLTRGRAALYEALLNFPESHLPTAVSELDSAVSGLRAAGQQQYLPLALLTRAWLRAVSGPATSPGQTLDGARADLDEAWQIAERGSMKLHMADVHLHRARLFGSWKVEAGSQPEARTYPWNTHPDGSARGPRDDLAAARQLIEECGYRRRREELEDAEAAFGH